MTSTVPLLLLALTLASTATPMPLPTPDTGAPLGNEDVQVHVVEPRAHTSQGRHELTLYPLTAQLDSGFTRHAGLALAYNHHFFERLSVSVTPFFNYLSEESGFQGELIGKASLQAEAASALLLHYGATAGVELVPIDGKFAFGEHLLGHFSLVLNVGVGAAQTRVQLSGDGFGDTGVRFLGAIGLGARLSLGDRFALRLEVRDLITTARIAEINGCEHADLTAIQAGSPTRAACDAGAFASDVELSNARSLLSQASSEVLNHVSLMLGVSVLF
ncbi:MAG: outer membrane beta-barrel domain-containing protein [Myxococcales bacterium]|jgi:outer membrane beta-barrel protein|nr:outer membrane beta-barrel domain-containing protein [Myxococcales bacterium]